MGCNFQETREILSKTRRLAKLWCSSEAPPPLAMCWAAQHPPGRCKEPVLVSWLVWQLLMAIGISYCLSLYLHVRVAAVINASHKHYPSLWPRSSRARLDVHVQDPPPLLMTFSEIIAGVWASAEKGHSLWGQAPFGARFCRSVIFLDKVHLLLLHSPPKPWPIPIPAVPEGTC